MVKIYDYRQVAERNREVFLKVVGHLASKRLMLPMGEHIPSNIEPLEPCEFFRRFSECQGCDRRCAVTDFEVRDNGTGRVASIVVMDGTSQEGCAVEYEFLVDGEGDEVMYDGKGAVKKWG